MMSNFDILEWLKTQETKQPIFSLMSCNILTSPIALIALKNAFSLDK